MNIDDATAVIFCELGFPAPLGRGLFLLSRAVGLLAHAWEQMNGEGASRARCRPAGSTPTTASRRARCEIGAGPRSSSFETLAYARSSG